MLSSTTQIKNDPQLARSKQKEAVDRGLWCFFSYKSADKTIVDRAKRGNLYSLFDLASIYEKHKTECTRRALTLYARFLFQNILNIQGSNPIDQYFILDDHERETREKQALSYLYNIASKEHPYQNYAMLLLLGIKFSKLIGELELKKFLNKTVGVYLSSFTAVGYEYITISIDVLYFQILALVEYHFEKLSNQELIHHYKKGITQSIDTYYDNQHTLNKNDIDWVGRGDYDFDRKEKLPETLSAYIFRRFSEHSKTLFSYYEDLQKAGAAFNFVNNHTLIPPNGIPKEISLVVADFLKPKL
jgi:hypothetical protein